MTLLALVAPILVGCGSSVGPSKFADINAKIFQPSCAAFSSCHSIAGASQAGHLNLVTDPYATLINVMADQTKAKAEGRVRVKPGDSANSFLYFKLTLAPQKTSAGPDCSADTDGYGTCMPYTSPPLAQDFIDGIKAWIDGGALNN